MVIGDNFRAADDQYCEVRMNEGKWRLASVETSGPLERHWYLIDITFLTIIQYKFGK